MKLDLSDDQRLLESTLARAFAEHSTGSRIRAAEPLGFDEALWKVLVDQGVPALRVPEAAGGGGMSLMHAVLAAEQAGRHLASAPLVEAVVTNRLIAQLPASSMLTALLGDVLAGESIATLALHDTARRPRQIVPAGAVARAVVSVEGADVVVRKNVRGEALPRDGAGQSLHAAIAAQRLDFSACDESLRIAGAAPLHAAAVAEWKVLTAAMLAAIALKALEEAAKYAGEREAFGRKIGEYQGVSHALADAFTDMDGARLFVWRAVDAIARREEGAAALVSMAYWWSASRAGAAALKALRVFGGYGATLEYDAQLYFRRANAHAIVAGSPDRELHRAADLLFGAADGAAALPEAGEVGISFASDEAVDAARAKARAFCARHGSPALTKRLRDSEDGWDLDLQKALAREKLLYPELPAEYGGAGMSEAAASAVREVFAEQGWSLPIPAVTNILWKMIHHFGSDRLKRDLLPGMAAGDVYGAFGYTEPSCGSDIFAAKTTATKVGDEWLINGQKMFTSGGHRSDYNLMITRTAPDKYRGITLFFAPVRQPGYSASEIRTAGDERTNVTFYSDVRVPDAYRLGEVNGGVKLMAQALALEQSSGGLYVTALRHLIASALEWARAPGDEGAPIEDPGVRLAIAETIARTEVADALSRRSIWAFENGRVQKHEGPMVKLLGSESWKDCSLRLLQVAAPDSLLRGYEAAGGIEFQSRHMLPATIYAGTSEVHRSLIAEAGLGLPRTR